MANVDDLPTPTLLIDRAKLQANVQEMQGLCDAHHLELRPHIKTHKMVEVARRQLAAGAKGLTCAKLGEAEAMLAAGPRGLFIAHSLVDLRQAPRIRALREKVEDFRVGLTSEAHLEALSRLAREVGGGLDVMMAIDTGLHREGTRSLDATVHLAARTAEHPHLTLRGFYTHEGFFYAIEPSHIETRAIALIEQLDAVRNVVGKDLAIWPGCSVSARAIARNSAGRVQAVRPGSYMFGDMSLSTTTKLMPTSSVAAEVLATVVDRPEPGLALIDAGSKTFSSDRTAGNLFAVASDGRDLSVVRVNEEHGYLRGSAVDRLALGERIRFVPAHICTVVNLTDSVAVVEGDKVVDTWAVEARGRVQ